MPIRTAVIARAVAVPHDEAVPESEIQLVPLLDVVMNVLLFLLASVSTVFTAHVPVSADGRPATPGPSAPSSATVVVSAAGWTVGTPSGFLQAGCTRLGAAAVAVRRDEDPRALTQCLDRARRTLGYAEPALGAASVQVAGDGALRYEDLVATLDAVRETEPGRRDLFPSARLGILR